MKRLLFPLFLLILGFSLFAASQVGKEALIERDDLFKSERELESFEFRESLSKSQEDFYRDVRISLMTVGPGSLLWENFGHASFVVEMPSGETFMFDYGIFSFDEDFYLNFALGRMYYEVWETWADLRADSFIEDDRTIEILELDLSPLEKANLIDFLTYNTEPGNQTYLYDYFFDNCSTRLRDIYKSLKGEEFESWAKSVELNESLRSLSIRYMSRSTFFTDWAVNYLLASDVDKRATLWEAMFLPDYLMLAIEEFEKRDSEVLYQSQGRKDVPSVYPFYLYSILFAVAVGLVASLCQMRRRSLRLIGDIFMSLIYLLLTVMSLILIFFMFFSIHSVTYFNTNALIISPLLALFMVFHILAMTGREKWRERIRKWAKAMFFITLSMLIIKGIFMSAFIIDNIVYYLMMLIIYFVESHYLLKKRQK